MRALLKPFAFLSLAQDVAFLFTSPDTDALIRFAPSTGTMNSSALDDGGSGGELILAGHKRATPTVEAATLPKLVEVTSKLNES